MITLLLEAITKVLYSGFKKDIYIDRLRQGFKSPCFFVREISGSQKQELGNRRQMSHLIEVRYFPSDSFNCKRELNAVSNALYEILEYIPLTKDRPVHGLDLKHTISDGVLVFTVNYKYCVTKPEERQYMEKLKQSGGIKYG